MTTPTPEELEQARQLFFAVRDAKPWTSDVLIARIASALHEARPQWREIETAPKDGTRVLLFYAHKVMRRALPFVEGEIAHQEERTQVTSGEFKDGCWYFVMGGGWVDEWYTMRSGGPSHWMPLPSPPE